MIEKLIGLIQEISESRFYGELVVRFENGRIVIIKKTENIKI